MLIPGFGLIANLVLMAYYLIGPVFGLGTFKEPLAGPGHLRGLGPYGAYYFVKSSKKKGKAILLEKQGKRSVTN